MMTIDADYIRRFVTNSYVKPARERGEKSLSIAVKSVESDLKKLGFQRGNTPLVCSALGGKKFQKENGISLEHRTGPASGQSTTVVFHFLLPGGSFDESNSLPVAETPEKRALRLTEKLRGLMKEEIASHGGAAGFLRWVRSEEAA
jgi:hypothetical protein